MSKTKNFWITNAVFVTMDEKRTVRSGSLFIEDGVITQWLDKLPKGLTIKSKNVIDADGTFILPGFIQTHVHLCQTLFRNHADDLELLDWLKEKIWPLESSHTAKSLRLSAEIGVQELLSSGTTCILDMATVRHTEAVLEVIEESGIRASVGKCLMDRAETSPKGLIEETAKAIAEAIRIHKKWNGRAGGRIRISYAPRFAISCTDELLKRVAEIARDQDALIHTHASENRGELQMVKQLTGLDNISYLDKVGVTKAPLVLAHCVWVDESQKKILCDRNVAVSHCPTSNLKLASGIAEIPKLRKMGITVSLGADGAACNNSLNMFQEMKLAALIQKPIHGPTAMPAHECLAMATIEGAKSLKWDKEIGSIEIGKRADLISLDLNTVENAVVGVIGKSLPTFESIASSVVYASGREHVMWTMVDGKMVYTKRNTL
ncbi:MAG: 5'-deoxyadenosine deaminase [Xanthomonadaceae bacterium]|nr:5'-deoxyadenosine deaminase [Xanthomonadaceae bacterium]